MSITLQLRHQAELQGSAAAWFIPGASAQSWLSELVHWQIPLARVRLYIAPDDQNDAASGGVLVIPPQGVQPSAVSRAGGYRRVADRLYLPLDGRIDPPVQDNEWVDLLPGDDEIYLWHPARGLVCFPRQTVLRVADLLAAPPRRAAQWDRAQPGTAIVSRLISIEPDLPVDPMSFLEEGRDDIGTRPPNLKFLPPTQREQQSSSLAGPAGAAKAMVAKAISWFTRCVPHTGSRRTWINDVEDWAGRTLGQYSDWLHQRRYKELARLLEMLTHRPDEGLKYALPLGTGDHRGVCRPGGDLARHDVNFDLRRLGGGGPADFWDVPADFRAQLMIRYRELANREIALGRHRRAAYIFAELLGDLHAAAATLADGGHFREAAALYQDRLNQPQEAARCLRQGGYWQQAIELYEQLGMHETAGDLYRELEDFEAADQAYRRAVNGYTQGLNFQQAAALLEHKLKQPGEAGECLLRGWPFSGQARQCMAELFRLFARHCQHERAMEQVVHLSDAVVTSERLSLLADVLAEVAVSYPDANVGRSAADSTRVLVANGLPQALPAETRLLTDALRRLAPQDRLLARDCQRFVGRREATTLKPPPAPVSRAGLKLVREIQLEPCDWRAFVASGDVFYAAGYRDDEIVVVRGLPDGSVHQPHKKPWRVERALIENPILMACDPQPGAEHVYVHVATLPTLRYDRPFPPHGDFHDPVRVQPLRSASQLTRALCSNQRMIHCLNWTVPSDLHVINHNAEGEVIGGHSFSTLKVDQIDSFPTLLVHQNLVCVAAGRTLAIWDGRQETLVEAPDAIHVLTGSPPFTRHRVVAGLEHGALFYAGDPRRVKAVRLAENLHRPAVGLTRSGHLIAASAAEIQVYDTQGGRLKFLAQTRGNADPLAILAPMRPDQFIVAHGNGHLLVYQVQ